MSYKPISSKDESRLHHSVKKMLPGILLGCVLRAVRGWSGDLLTTDSEDLENLSVRNLRHTVRAPESRRRMEAVVATCGRIFQTLLSSPNPTRQSAREGKP